VLDPRRLLRPDPPEAGANLGQHDVDRNGGLLALRPAHGAHAGSARYSVRSGVRPASLSEKNVIFSMGGE